METLLFGAVFLSLADVLALCLYVAHESYKKRYHLVCHLLTEAFFYAVLVAIEYSVALL